MVVALFLTSKVRLHCDYTRFRKYGGVPTGLFLTSNVRLHCDERTPPDLFRMAALPFPDLKGQAPLRHFFDRNNFEMKHPFS